MRPGAPGRAGGNPQSPSEVHGAKTNEVCDATKRDATKTERHVCARARDGERPVSYESVDGGDAGTIRQGGIFERQAKVWGLKEEDVEPLAVMGALAIVIGILGAIVLIKGKKKRRP